MTNTKTTCPVAALVDEAHKLIDAFRAAEEARGEEKDADRERLLEHKEEIAHVFLQSALDRATYLLAESGKGALFQLCVVSDLALDIQGLVGPGRDFDAAEAICKKIDRTLYSIAYFIEGKTGDRLEDVGHGYYLTQHLNEHCLVSEAMALAEVERKTAA